MTDDDDRVSPELLILSTSAVLPVSFCLVVSLYKYWPPIGGFLVTQTWPVFGSTCFLVFLIHLAAHRWAVVPALRTCVPALLYGVLLIVLLGIPFLTLIL